MCGSFAINDNLHGRKTGKDLDLCDVCYWRFRSDIIFNQEEFSASVIRKRKIKNKGE